MWALCYEAEGSTLPHPLWLLYGCCCECGQRCWRRAHLPCSACCCLGSSPFVEGVDGWNQVPLGVPASVSYLTLLNVGDLFAVKSRGTQLLQGTQKEMGYLMWAVFIFIFFIYQYNFTTLIIVYFFASARAVTHAMFLSSSHWKAERKNRLEQKMLLFGMSTSDAFGALLLGRYGPGSASRCPGCPLGSRCMFWLPVSACAAYHAILNYIQKWLWGSINA